MLVVHVGVDAKCFGLSHAANDPESSATSLIEVIEEVCTSVVNLLYPCSPHILILSSTGILLSSRDTCVCGLSTYFHRDFTVYTQRLIYQSILIAI